VKHKRKHKHGHGHEQDHYEFNNVERRRADRERAEKGTVDRESERAYLQQQLHESKHFRSADRYARDLNAERKFAEKQDKLDCTHERKVVAADGNRATNCNASTASCQSIGPSSRRSLLLLPSSIILVHTLVLSRSWKARPRPAWTAVLSTTAPTSSAMPWHASLVSTRRCQHC
jgi:hypothetical protein